MRSFSFKSTYDENQNIERIITERNRKLAKQQVIFAIVLLIVVALLAWYIFRKVVYTEFDGYVQTEYIDYRAMEDTYLFRQYKDVGDIVFPGDTLYSYMYVNLLGIGDMHSEPAVIANDRNLRVQLGTAYSEVNVLRVQIAELEKQIEKEDNNIRFGLTDNSHKMDLQRALAEAREKLRAALNKVYLYNNLKNESSAAVNRFGKYATEYTNEQWDIDYTLKQLYERNSSAIHYAIVQDTAIVTKLWAPPFSRVFKKEQIIQLELLSLDHSNMQVVAYVPTGDMGKINNNTQAEVIVNDDVSFNASVQLLGARTEDLPEELRNSLSHTYTTVMVVFRPDKDAVLPLWAVVDRVPVRVRIKNYDNGRRNDGSDYWHVNRNGLTEESLHHMGMLRQRERDRADSIARAKAAADSIAQAEAAAQPAAQQTVKPAQPASTQQQPAAAATQTRPAQTQPAQTQSAQTQSAAAVQNEPGYHLIQPGETLYKIAEQYHTTINKILACNPDIDPDLIFAGTRLRLPASAQ